jgi:hypothetical protein
VDGEVRLQRDWIAAQRLIIGSWQPLMLLLEVPLSRKSRHWHFLKLIMLSQTGPKPALKRVSLPRVVG